MLFWQAMKHAFALRMSLGDPGPDPANPFVNITKQDQLLDDTLSRKFADELRCAVVAPSFGASSLLRISAIVAPSVPSAMVYSRLRCHPNAVPARRAWGRHCMHRCRADIRDDRTQPPENYGGRWNVLQDPPEDHGTCHFSIVGGDGMAVAMTTTVSSVRFSPRWRASC